MKKLLGWLGALILVLTEFISPARAHAAVTPKHPTARFGLAESFRHFVAKVNPFSKNHPLTPRKYTVKAGDCLWFIAQRFFGNGEKWRAIYARNQSVIGSDPNLILPGQVLTITGALPKVSNGGPDKENFSLGDNISGGAPPPAPHHHHGASPLRGVRNLVWGRTDMGVDFAGSGPLYAVGHGVITNIWGAGWPGGVYILEHIESGPGAGKYIYYAENISPQVSVGQHVDENTVVGTITGGIEIGWGTATPEETLAAANGDYPYDGFASREGKDMRAFLHSLQRRHHGHHGSAGGGAVTSQGACDSTQHGGSSFLPEHFKEIVNFLVAHGYHHNASAGIAGNMWQESDGNPESGTPAAGGLIGWTATWPSQLGPMQTGNVHADLMRQLEAVLLYDNAVGSKAQINAAATSPAAAADNYSNNYEKPSLPALGNREAAAEAVASTCGF